MSDEIASEPKAASASAAPAPQLNVLVVARQPLVRAGLRGLLEDRGEVRIVGQARSGDDATEVAVAAHPAVALAAWDGTHLSEMTALAETLGAQGIPVVLLCDAPAAEDLSAAVSSGVRGLLLSDTTADDLIAALRAITQGLLVLDPALARTWSTFAPLARPDDFHQDEPLTEREREVLELLALGLPNKSIAKRLRISEHTVKFHVGSILSKLAAGSRTEAVTRAARRGLLAL